MSSALRHITPKYIFVTLTHCKNITVGCVVSNDKQS